MNIRIVSTPPGEAPEHIRAAWVGMTLPLAVEGPKAIRVRGIKTKPKGILLTLLRWIFDPPNRERGYLVEAITAVDLLNQHAPEAAAWWRENAPYLLKPRLKLLFNESVCEMDLPTRADENVRECSDPPA